MLSGRAADKRSNENYLKSPECTLIASPYAYILFAGNVAKGLTLPLSISTANLADREGKTSMATEQRDQIVDTSMEARKAEPGLSVLLLSTISTGLASLILCVTWLVFVH